MLHMPIQEVIAKICEGSKVSEEEIKSKIKAKLDSLNGLVSDEGAAYIIANELGVKLFEDQVANKPLQIKDILVGAKNVDTIGKVIRIFEPRTFTRNGEESKVGNFIIADETGTIKIVLWDAKRIEWLEDGTLKVGNVVRLKNGYVRENKYSGGSKEVHLGTRGHLVIDDKTKIDVKVPEGGAAEGAKEGPMEAKIEALVGGGRYKLRGTVVRVFTPNFYDACKECNKKVSREGEKGKCVTHGEVEFTVTPILNFVLDDGTENIRCTAFRELAEKLTNSSGADLHTLSQNSTEQLQARMDEKLLGFVLNVEGFVRENKQFNRIELSLNSAEKANPLAIIKRLQGGE